LRVAIVKRGLGLMRGERVIDKVDN
jgi:hypothetical protein